MLLRVDQAAAVQDPQGLLHGALRETGLVGDVAVAELCANRQ
jgi:hypothetical protein